MSKILKSFKLGDEIPSGAKFVCHTVTTASTRSIVSFIYEVTEKAASTPKSGEKEKEVKELIERTIKYLNLKSNGSYTAKNKAHASCIRARINDGATKDQLKLCIDNQCREWLENPKMRPYLRPETLFSNKFWGYISGKTEHQEADEAVAELDSILENIGG